MLNFKNYERKTREIIDKISGCLGITEKEKALLKESIRDYQDLEDLEFTCEAIKKNCFAAEEKKRFFRLFCKNPQAPLLELIYGVGRKNAG